MKKKKKIIKRFLIVMICYLTFTACKNSNEESGSFLSEEKSFTPTTATEIEKALPSLSEMELSNPEEVKAFYGNRKNEPAWHEEEIMTSLYEELQSSEDEGLFFQDYHGERLKALWEIPEEAKGAEERVELEFLMTDAFLKYARHLYFGKLDPNELYSLWGIRRQPKDFRKILQTAVEEKKVGEALESLKPDHQIYQGLKESLSEYRTSKKEDSTFAKIEEGPAIRPGEEDERVPRIAERLKQLEFLNQDHEVEDNSFDSEVEAALKRFQEIRGLQPDGIVGNSTLTALNMDDTDRFNKILVNLERWRWYPRDLGEHYILVNIPDFKLAVVKNGDTVRTHNVVAGSKARQTPVFTDTLQYIVINPQWNIPPTIRKQDVIPKASNNPSYLSNNNMYVTGPGGNVLDPYSIDWDSPEVQNYRFTQRPGPSNPLGRVKIIYPNKYLIYLHDTPAQSLFQREDRAESSGCVRVENAIDLSAYVVDNQEDWNLEKLKKAIASGKTQQVKITKPIQVHHFYWTAWRGENETYFADDVYELDEDVYNALTSSN